MHDLYLPMISVEPQNGFGSGRFQAGYQVGGFCFAFCEVASPDMLAITGNPGDATDCGHALRMYSLKFPLVFGLYQVMDQGCCRCEAHLQSSLARRQTKPQSDVGFARPGWPKSDDILVAIHVITTGQFHHQNLVQRGHGLEVEAVETFDSREFCRLDPPFHHTPLLDYACIGLLAYCFLRENTFH